MVFSKPSYLAVIKNKSAMRRNFASIIKLLVPCVITILITVFLYKTFFMIQKLYDDDGDDNSFNSQIRAEMRQQTHPRHGAFFSRPRNVKPKKIDWHDYRFMEMERKRSGIGEHGESGHIKADEESERKRLFGLNGFNGLLSDKISLNRSVADIRHKDCANQKYLSELPTVSVVVPFFNEHFSTLLRTCYSVLNRSPDELIVEIILVDDASNRRSLGDQLDNYVAEHLPKVKIVRLPQRSGLIIARLAGAKIATGDVLLFLDSHTEANINWLPPLLDPIAENYKVCVCPFIDVIAYDTFEYRAQDEGARGAFDWQFYYKRLPLLPDDLANPTRPFRSPVMAGGLFAISAKFFWEIGGYDDGLDIWGGEQYELSFKIWQCGGEMYDAPCSRVGHIYRGGPVPNSHGRDGDFLHKNYKRVAEVWMDEYKNYLYERDPDKYENLDAGDLTAQHAIREKLQCKPFKWFMEEVAFDLPKKYPPVEPPDFASGTIRSLASPTLCADTLNHGNNEPVGLYICAENHKRPQSNQFFVNSWHKDIRLRSQTKCWDVSSSDVNAPVLFYDCHGQQGNQYWRYDPDKKWLMQGHNNRCLDANVKTRELYVNTCNDKNLNMKWEFGTYNRTALANFERNGVVEDS